MSTLTGSTTTPITIGGFDIWIIASSGRVNVAGADAVRLTGNGAQLLINGEVLARDGRGVLADPGFGGSTSVIVTANGVVLSSGVLGVGLSVASGTANRVVNDGLIYGASTGLSAAGFADVIQNHGTVMSAVTGMSLTSGFKNVANTGEIAGGQIGLNFAAPNVTFANTGQITGGATGGVVVNANGHGRLVNHGEIAATGPGVSVNGANQEFRLVNHGTVTGGGDVAYDSDEAADRVDVVRNSGLISGDVRLGGGDDVYRGIGQGTLDGTVHGGPGDDRLFGSHADDVLHGDGGADELRGRGGDDVLDGGAGADRLFGGRGDDVLFGSRGRDVLNGGPGDDVLTGGAGPDRFVFGRNAGDDVVADFARGQNDKIDLTAFALAPGGFAKVQAAASNAPGRAVLIDFDALGGQGSVLVQGMGLGAMTASDFIFV